MKKSIAGWLLFAWLIWSLGALAHFEARDAATLTVCSYPRK
jgi:hypothetical protein